jgi:hypothetical protein
MEVTHSKEQHILKYLFGKCPMTHLMIGEPPLIKNVFERIESRFGAGETSIAAARHTLGTIYTTLLKKR